MTNRSRVISLYRRRNFAGVFSLPTLRANRSGKECIKPLKLTVTKAAKYLGVTRQALNNLVNGKAGISAEMAIRLSKAFGSSPEVWLGLQAQYDLARVEREAGKIKVRRVA